jgi:DNA-binding CsgD family transcriptional regulator
VAEKQLDNMIERLKGDSAAGSWSQLEKRIKDTDQPFFKHIGEKPPKLTPAELKLCYYLRMNLSTKEIAGLTYQTYDSVRIARTRLRKKLQLTGDDNLVAYLATF